MQSGGVIAGRFEIDRLIGEGGMGVVYRALDRETGQPVALKLLAATGAERTSESDERFDREIRLLAAIEHPRVARYIGHGRDADGRPFLAMQWMEGCDLAAALAAGPLSLADSLHVLTGAAEAMAAVHARGIVHRDLKPSNLFLRDRASRGVVLLDFGVSRRRETSGSLTGTAVVGTPHYMAPEQVSSAREVLPAADVFSLGCVFYECLTGRRPFDAQHLYGVLARILYDKPEPVQAFNPAIPAAWAELLTRMLRKQPGERPGDGAALLRQLASLPAIDAEPTATARAGAVRTVSDQVLVCVVLVTLPGPAEPVAGGSDPFDSIRSAVQRFGCPIERLPDGSLLATVPPRGSATDLVRIAARCALYLREQMPNARISVATGRAPLGPGPVVGDAVDRAAALLEQARPGDAILLDTVSRELLDGRFITGSRDSLKILVGERPEFDDSRPLLGKPTACVGRELELIQLEAVVASAFEERAPKAAVVLGAPGIGKSRLRHELLRRLRLRYPEATVLIGYGDPLSAGSPYVLLAEALRRKAGIHTGDDPAQAGARIVDELCRRIDPERRERVSEFLGELAGVPFPADRSPPLLAARSDHRVMSEQITLAFIDWLAAECAATPVVLVLDDLQWGDALTIKVLESALRDLGHGAVFVLALGRPETEEAFPRLFGEHKALSLSLRALGAKASEQLVKSVLGEELSREALERIIQLAAGNALFLEELIRAAADGKAGDVPETVVAMLQARLSRLQPEAREVLRAAAVLGETFWRGGVRAICESWAGQKRESSPESSLEPWLAQLVEGELVARSRGGRFPEHVEYAFRHALVCDAAAGLLTDADRRSGHLAAGRWLEDMGETDAIVLARHAEGGGDGARAIAFYARAAQQSIGQNDFGAALARADKGIALGAEGETLGLLGSVRASALYKLGRWTEVAKAGLPALELLPEGGVIWCATVENLLQVLPNVSMFAESQALSDALLRIEPTAEARSTYLRAVAPQLLGFAISGLHARGRACLAFIAKLGVPDGDILSRGYTNLYGAIFEFILGDDMPLALGMVDQAARDLAESQVMYRLSLAHIVQSFVWWGLGDHARAERLARLAGQVATDTHDDYHTALSGWYLGQALYEQGDPTKLDEAQRAAEAMLLLEGSAMFVASAQVIFAGVALARGDWARAETEARLSRQALGPIPPFHLMACAHLLTALKHQGRTAEAAALAAEDLATLARLDGPACSGVMVRVAAAEALWEGGDRAQAEVVLREALRQIATRAASISDAGMRQTFLDGRPENRRARALAASWRVAPAG